MRGNRRHTSTLITIRTDSSPAKLGGNLLYSISGYGPLPPSAMKRSIRSVTTGSGTEPSSSTASWNARILNLAPSVFSVRRFVALLELGELLLRASDVRLVRAAELKELPLPTKV